MNKHRNIKKFPRKGSNPVQICKQYSTVYLMLDVYFINKIEFLNKTRHYVSCHLNMFTSILVLNETPRKSSKSMHAHKMFLLFSIKNCRTLAHNFKASKSLMIFRDSAFLLDSLVCLCLAMSMLSTIESFLFRTFVCIFCLWIFRFDAPTSVDCSIIERKKTGNNNWK